MGKNRKPKLSTKEKNMAIHFKLDELLIKLSTNTPLVEIHARQFLDTKVLTTKELELAGPSDVHIHLDLVDSITRPPKKTPVFIGDSQHLKDDVGTLFVYEQPDGFLLYFQHSGLVTLKTTIGSNQIIQGFITPKLLQHGRMHDLLFTSLSCFLRRKKYYLLHASAAVKQNGAAIFAGPPGCGKSTTVLNLALNGWSMLSNDTLLLQERPDGIYALPTPGGFSIRPESIKHIPALTAYVPQFLPNDFYPLSLSRLGLASAKPALITTISFPEIIKGPENQYQPISPALALARLTELSLDSWDTSTLSAHFSFLEQLSRQAKAASLKIINQQQLVELINQKM